MASVDITSLINLKKDANQSDLFDLFVQSYTSGEGVPLRGYIVDRGREMRLDLVCIDLYGNIGNLQMLQWINNIDNPYSIRQGDFIFWADNNTLNNFDVLDPKIVVDNRSALIDSFKNSVLDPARRDYLNNRGNNTNLPPNILDSTTANTNKIQVENNKIVAGAGLFPNPNTQARPEVPASSGSLGDIAQTPDSPTAEPNPDEFERVLVRQFIRTGSSS